jgi:nitroreductase
MSIPEQPGTLFDIYHRRSIRSYLPQPVDQATLERLLDAAVQAPTALHAEPWGFAVVQDRALMQRYSERAKSLFLAEPAPPGMSPEAKKAMREMMTDPAFNIFYDAGTLVVICRRSGGPLGEGDCWLAAENFMLAAAAEGLGTCCIGLAQAVLNTAEAKRELGIPDEGAAVVAIIVGVPRETPAGSPRKPPQILSWLA